MLAIPATRCASVTVLTPTLPGKTLYSPSLTASTPTARSSATDTHREHCLTAMLSNTQLTCDQIDRERTSAARVNPKATRYPMGLIPTGNASDRVMCVKDTHRKPTGCATVPMTQNQGKM